MRSTVPRVDARRAAASCGVSARAVGQAPAGLCAPGCGARRGWFTDRRGGERATALASEGAGQEDDQLLEPEEDLLACRAVHEGRHDRVLSRRVALAAAVSSQSPGGDDALSGRDRREVVLSKGCARVRARVDAHGADLERGYAARDSILRLRRRRIVAVRGQSGDDSAAHLGESRRLARAVRLVRARPGSQGGALCGCDPLRPGCCDSYVKRSDCRATSRRRGKPGCTSCSPSGASAPTRSRAR